MTVMCVAARFKAKPGNEQAVSDLLAQFVVPGRAEAGNLSYDIHQNAEDPTDFLIYDAWENDAAIDSHLSDPDVGKVVSQLLPLLAVEPEVLRFKKLS